MKKLLSISVASLTLIGCTTESKINMNNNSGLERAIEERLSVCRSNGERLVKVPDQFGENKNYFACAQNSWDCIPVTIYESTPTGPKLIIIVNSNGEVDYYKGKQAIHYNKHKCTAPRN